MLNSDYVLRLPFNAQITPRLYDSPYNKREGKESWFLCICLSSRRHNTSNTSIVHLPLGAMMAGLGGESVEDDSSLPKFDYYLDESDPDIVVLRRQDGSFVAAFSAQGSTREGIVEAAKEDYWKVIEANAESLGRQENGDRQSRA
jgi:hypothetical protein